MASKTSKLSELDQRLKPQFFAQYWGQEVAGSKYFKKPKTVMFNYDLFGSLNSESNIVTFENFFLWLKPLSKITDEDAEELQHTLINVVGLDGFIRQNSIELVREVISNYEKIDCLFMLPSSFVDKARKLGYAIDWNGYKVSDLIEKGWIKIT
jgi:hypothetical protein